MSPFSGNPRAIAGFLVFGGGLHNVVYGMESSYRAIIMTEQPDLRAVKHRCNSCGKFYTGLLTANEPKNTAYVVSECEDCAPSSGPPRLRKLFDAENRRLQPDPEPPVEQPSAPVQNVEAAQTEAQIPGEAL
jgi:hypothetical protein